MNISQKYIFKRLRNLKVEYIISSDMRNELLHMFDVYWQIIMTIDIFDFIST